MTPRRETFPTFAEGEMPAPSALERWARSARSDVVIEIHRPGYPPERERALNPESRQVLLALARCARPGADAATVALGELARAAGQSPGRCRQYLIWLDEAGLIRLVSDVRRGASSVVVVRFLGVLPGDTEPERENG